MTVVPLGDVFLLEGIIGEFLAVASVMQSPDENTSSFGAGGDDNLVSSFLKVPPWSC